MDNETTYKTPQIDKEKAYNRLAAKCSAAEYCEFDLRRTMTRWQLPHNQQDEIINKLRSDRFIDDERYARAFVADKYQYNHWGQVRITHELRMRNIPDHIIDTALNDIIQPDDNLAQLTTLLNQKRKTTTGRTQYEINAKLTRYALSKGYTYTDITTILHTDFES